MSVMVFALSINFLWSILTFLNLTHCDITVQKILLKVNSRVDGEEELPLVSPDPGVSDPLDQLGVLVDQPGLPQHVGGRVLQLKHNQGNIRVRRNFFKENFLGKVLFGILHVPCKDNCDTDPLGELGVHHEVVDVFLRPGQLQLPGDHRHQQGRAPRPLQQRNVKKNIYNSRHHHS